MREENEDLKAQQPFPPTCEENWQLSILLTGKLRLRHDTVPAPSPGTYALLEAVETPFLSPMVLEEGRSSHFPSLTGISFRETMTAFYLLLYGREEANQWQLTRKRSLLLLGRDTPSPPLSARQKKALWQRVKKKISPEQKRNWKKIRQELICFFSLENGFTLLPEGKDPQCGYAGSPALELCTLLQNAQMAFPGKSFEELLWHTPLLTISYGIAAHAKIMGVELSPRPAISRMLWKNFQAQIRGPQKNGQEKTSCSPAILSPQKCKNNAQQKSFAPAGKDLSVTPEKSSEKAEKKLEEYPGNEIPAEESNSDAPESPLQEKALFSPKTAGISVPEPSAENEKELFSPITAPLQKTQPAGENLSTLTAYSVNIPANEPKSSKNLPPPSPFISSGNGTSNKRAFSHLSAGTSTLEKKNRQEKSPEEIKGSAPLSSMKKKPSQAQEKGISFREKKKIPSLVPVEDGQRINHPNPPSSMEKRKNIFLFLNQTLPRRKQEKEEERIDLSSLQKMIRDILKKELPESII